MHSQTPTPFEEGEKQGLQNWQCQEGTAKVGTGGGKGGKNQGLWPTMEVFVRDGHALAEQEVSVGLADKVLQGINCGGQMGGEE